MIKNIRKNLKKIDDDSLYSPKEIAEMGLIINQKKESSVFPIYRLIKSGRLKAINNGTEEMPTYFVKGSELRKYVTKKFDL